MIWGRVLSEAFAQSVYETAPHTELNNPQDMNTLLLATICSTSRDLHSCTYHMLQRTVFKLHCNEHICNGLTLALASNYKHE